MAAKTNEIPAVRDLLKAFADLDGAVITAWNSYSYGQGQSSGAASIGFGT